MFTHEAVHLGCRRTLQACLFDHHRTGLFKLVHLVLGCCVVILWCLVVWWWGGGAKRERHCHFPITDMKRDTRRLKAAKIASHLALRSCAGTSSMHSNKLKIAALNLSDIATENAVRICKKLVTSRKISISGQSSCAFFEAMLSAHLEVRENSSKELVIS